MWRPPVRLEPAFFAFSIVFFLAACGGSASSDRDTPLDDNPVPLPQPPTESLSLSFLQTPSATAGSEGTTLQGTLAWQAGGTAQQSTFPYSVTADSPDLTITNASGNSSVDQPTTHSLGYACATVGMRTFNLSVTAEDQQANTTWQVDCRGPADGNANFSAAEFYQGPLTALFESGGAVISYVNAVEERQALAFVLIQHDSAIIPELEARMIDASLPTSLPTSQMRLQTPQETGNGRWASIYSVEIPAPMMRSSNILEFILDPADSINETSESDNLVVLDMADLGFAVVGRFRPVFVPIQAEGRTPANIDPDEYLVATLDLWPVAGYEPRVRQTYTYTGGVWDWNTAVDEMIALWNAEGEADEFYHGLYRQPDLFFGGTAGVGVIGMPVAVSTSLDSPFAQNSTLAHEFGHNFGIAHAPGGCGGQDPDPDFPYPGAGIGPHGGWLFSQDTFIAPEDGYFDVMSYCRPQFVSDYNYQNVINNVGSPAQAANAQQQVARAEVGVTPGDQPGSLALSGRVDRHGIWSLSRATVTGKSPRKAEDGAFSVALYGADGLELYAQTLDCHHIEHLDTARWAVRVPLPERQVAAVRIRDSDGNLMLDEDLRF